MDASRFDTLFRSWAERSSRRRALRQIGGGGALAGLAAVVGLGRTTALAQDDEITICTLVLDALTSAGPNEDETWAGELELEIGPDGEIDAGLFTTEDGASYEVVGQATGRAINLRIALDDNQYLSLTGTGQRDIDLCRGGVAGVFGGPERGDTGTWTAARPRANPTPSPTPTAAPIEPTEPSGGSDDPTPTSCPEQVCGGAQSEWDPVTCACVCPGGGVLCGSVCCPGGSICTDESSGSCQCPSGTELCGNSCVDSCPSGMMLDFDSCECVDMGDVPTATTNPCPAGQMECGGVCMDVTNDEGNCGFCGNVCPKMMPCIGSSCMCPPGWTYCDAPAGCVDTASNPGHCGACGNICLSGQSCSGGVCS